jgi:RNA polymerase sigma-70 factor (ECF subfamily)
MDGGNRVDNRMHDNELVQRARNGDGDAFNRLVEKYQMKMFHLAYGMTRNREAADDLAQEVFLKAYSSLPKFRMESQFGTWLYRVAVNTIKDHVRKEGRSKALSFDESIHQMPEQEDAFLKKEQENEEAGMRRMLRRAIEELPEKYRLILTMRDIQGIPYGEIAEILRILPGTVDSRLFRARKQLKKQLNRLLITRGGKHEM